MWSKICFCTMFFGIFCTGFKKMGSWLTHDKPENLVHFILEDVGRSAQFIHDKAGSGAQTLITRLTGQHIPSIVSPLITTSFSLCIQK